eukprot:gb/GECH01008902.1/.p1 GENE.gb/GECH01008902.1/~~gb/GECH01008902.1/.p1  ORF type:complete len:389 (+),score=106.93 gb/GECH01008902.1/:1-1167(+)
MNTENENEDQDESANNKDDQQTRERYLQFLKQGPSKGHNRRKISYVASSSKKKGKTQSSNITELSVLPQYDSEGNQKHKGTFMRQGNRKRIKNLESPSNPGLNVTISEAVQTPSQKYIGSKRSKNQKQPNDNNENDPERNEKLNQDKIQNEKEEHSKKEQKSLESKSISDPSRKSTEFRELGEKIDFKTGPLPPKRRSKHGDLKKSPRIKNDPKNKINPLSLRSSTENTIPHFKENDRQLQEQKNFEKNSLESQSLQLDLRSLHHLSSKPSVTVSEPSTPIEMKRPKTAKDPRFHSKTSRNVRPRSAIQPRQRTFSTASSTPRISSASTERSNSTSRKRNKPSTGKSTRPSYNSFTERKAPTRPKSPFSSRTKSNRPKLINYTNWANS